MQRKHMRPWQDCDRRRLAKVRGVLTDIDDTLTTEGLIPPVTMAALETLRVARIPVIAVTGRPMGWSRAILERAPLEAIVAENGAVALIPGASGIGVEYADDALVRAANAVRLRAVAEEILRKVPAAKLSSDSVGRVTDIAFDHSEHFHLSPADVKRVVTLMRDHGLTATVSSIHINGWLGTNTKLTGARWIVERLYGRNLDEERAHWAYVGDSTNDEPMFAAFPLSVGVANLLDFADTLSVWPAYITQLDRGRGFAEVAETLLRVRAS